MPASYVYRQFQFFFLNVASIAVLCMFANTFRSGEWPATTSIVVILASLLAFCVAQWLHDKAFHQELVKHERILTGQWFYKGNFIHLKMPGPYILPVLVFGASCAYIQDLSMQFNAFLGVGPLLLIMRFIHSLLNADDRDKMREEIKNGSRLRSGQPCYQFEDGIRVRVSSLDGRHAVWQPDTPALRKKLLATCENMLGQTHHTAPAIPEALPTGKQPKY